MVIMFPSPADNDHNLLMSSITFIGLGNFLSPSASVPLWGEVIG